MKIKITTAAMAFLISLASYGQNSKPVTDYLNIPGPVTFNKEVFKLTWSSHPSATYYKQEYIGAKDNAEQFKKMVMIELLAGDARAADLAKAKMDELKQLKATNPLVNYEAFQKNGEVMIDFLLSENSADGKKVNIIERNVYRYRQVTDKNGQKGVMLFAVSERAYGNDVDAFLTSLKKTKTVLVNAVAAFAIPQITLRK